MAIRRTHGVLLLLSGGKHTCLRPVSTAPPLAATPGSSASLSATARVLTPRMGCGALITKVADASTSTPSLAATSLAATAHVLTPRMGCAALSTEVVAAASTSMAASVQARALMEEAVVVTDEVLSVPSRLYPAGDAVPLHVAVLVPNHWGIHLRGHDEIPNQDSKRKVWQPWGMRVQQEMQD